MDRLETRRNLDQLPAAYPEYSLQPTPLLDREDQKAFDDFLRQFDLDTHEPAVSLPTSTNSTTVLSSTPLPQHPTTENLKSSPKYVESGRKLSTDVNPPMPAQGSVPLEKACDPSTPTSVNLSSPMINTIDGPSEKTDRETSSKSPQKPTNKRKISDVEDIDPTLKGNNTRPPGRGKKAPHELLSEKEKKANHIASEQKRRQNIRLGFEQLVDIVPTLSQCHRSESAILQKSVEYIHQLIAQRQQLKQRIRELRVSAGDPSNMIDDFSSSDEDIY
ncbi:Transcription factor [Basidiobolus ranarum]|uniref:Transcription factor n=1 Tax=Basidiobolus ranarum TaxID=34480 RepID=A0ABR2X0T5_9FUNG